MDRESAERFGLAMSQEMQQVKSQSRIEVRIISGTHLLASDPNGKSDPVCFAWFGNKGKSSFYDPWVCPRCCIGLCFFALLLCAGVGC